MLKTLIKLQLEQMLNLMFSSGNMSKKNPLGNNKRAMTLLYAFLFVLFAFSFGSILASLYVPLKIAENELLYFMLVGAISFFIGVFTSVFTAQKLLYSAKDNDLLLSMPIKPMHIFISRLFAIAVLEYVSGMLITVPAVVVYIILGSPKLIAIIFYIIASLIFPLLAIAVIAVLGRLFAAILAKVKRKNTVTAVISLVFFIVYFYCYSNVMSLVTTVAENSDKLTESLKWILPLYRFGLAATGDLLSLLLLAFWCIIPAGLVIRWLSKSFIKIATANSGNVKIKYVKRKHKKRTALRALVSREFSRFFNMSQYMLNFGLGAILVIVVPVLALFNSNALLTEQFAGFSVVMSIIPCLCFGFIACLSCPTSVGISLEGNTFWLLKSLPIRIKDLFLSKILMNIILMLPSYIISSVIFGLALKLNILTVILIFISGLAIQSFIAVFGLFINILLPKLEWTNSAIVIKQSASVVITIFGSMGLVLISSVISVIIALSLSAFMEQLVASTVTLLILIVFFLVLLLVSSVLLVKVGIKKYNKI